MLGCACLVIRRLPVFFCTKYSGVKKVGGQWVATVLLLPMMPSDSLISIHTLRPARYVEVPSCEEDWCRALVRPLPSQKAIQGSYITKATSSYSSPPSVVFCLLPFVKSSLMSSYP